MCTEEEKQLLATPSKNTKERMSILAKHIGEEFFFRQTVIDPDYYPDREFEINDDGIPGEEFRGIIKGVKSGCIIFDDSAQNDEWPERVLEWQVFHHMITMPVENENVLDMPKEKAKLAQDRRKAKT